MYRRDLVYMEKLPARCVRVQKTHCPRVLPARDVPICELSSLFDNAALFVILLSVMLAIQWHTDSPRRSPSTIKEPEEWRQIELFPKARTNMT